METNENDLIISLKYSNSNIQRIIIVDVVALQITKSITYKEVNKFAVIDVLGTDIYFPILEDSIMRIVTCSLSSLNSCSRIKFTADNIDPTYFTLIDDLIPLFTNPITVSSSILSLYASSPDLQTENLDIKILNLGTLETDSSIPHFELKNQEPSFSIECTCVSAFYVDVNYTLTSNCSFLTLVSSSTNMKEISIDYSNIDYKDEIFVYVEGSIKATSTYSNDTHEKNFTLTIERCDPV